MSGLSIQEELEIGRKVEAKLGAANTELMKQLRDAWSELVTWQEQVFELRNEVANLKASRNYEGKQRLRMIVDPKVYEKARVQFLSLEEFRKKEILRDLEEP